MRSANARWFWLGCARRGGTAGRADPGGRAGARPSKQGLIADIEALYEEIVRLSREVHRLTELLREHGIEPDEGTSRSA